MTPLLIRWLGRVRYGDALRIQQDAVRRRRNGSLPDSLLLLEHPPVITVGRGGDDTHVLLSEPELRRRGIERFEAGRGGDVTFHGPGQLVGYPVLALPPGRRDAHRYLRDLEEALIRAAADLGVRAERSAGLTGIWVGRAKLAAIGVRLSTGWITSHGFAVNVGRDLSGFDAIVPCGIRDRRVTSLARLLDEEPTLVEVAALVARRLAEVFALEPCLPDEVEERLAVPGARTLSLKGEPAVVGRREGQP